MLYVLVLGNQMNVQYADVDPQPGLAVPVEVRRLSHVRHVICSLQVAGVVKVFENDVRRCLGFQTYGRRAAACSEL